MSPSAGTRRSIRLSRAEFLAAWRVLRLGPRPPLLDVPDHGDSLVARDAADRTALGTLVARGLAEPTPDRRVELAPDLVALLRGLDAPDLEVDLRCWADDDRAATSAHAAVSGAALVVALPTADGLELRPREVTTHALAAAVSAVLAVVPDVPPLRSGPTTMPVAEIGAGPRRTPAWADAPLRRILQLGAAVREDGRRRRIGPLTALDTADGRALVTRRGARAVFRPIDRAGLVRDLCRIASRP